MTRLHSLAICVCAAILANAQPFQFQWARQFGAAQGAASETAYATASRGGFHVVAGTVFGALPGQTSAGDRDAYIRKYDDTGNVVWTRQFGSPTPDDALGVAIDPNGNIIVAMNVCLTNSSITCDISIRKFDPSGNQQWSYSLATPVQESAGHVATDAAGNIYVSGTTRGTLPGLSTNGGADAILIKLDPAGAAVWTRQYGTAADDSAQGTGVDSSGNVVSCGYTGGSLPGFSNLGSIDAYLMKFDSGGNPIWTRQYGGSSGDLCTGLSIDPAGNIFSILDGSFRQVRSFAPDGTPGNSIGFGAFIEGIAADAAGFTIVGFITTTSFQGQPSAGSNDAYIQRFATNGTLQWTRLFGTPEGDSGRAVSFTGNALFMAGTTSGVFPGQAPGGGGDVYVRKYDLSGNLAWTNQFTSIGGGQSQAFGLALGNNRAISAGATNGALPGATALGDSDAFTAVHDFDGNLIWLRQFGTNVTDQAVAAGTDAAGNVVVAGLTNGVLPGQSKSGSFDAFLVKYDSSGNALWTRQIGFPSASSSRFEVLSVSAAGEIFAAGTAVVPSSTSGSSQVDFVVQRYDANGSLIWTRQIGTPGLEGVNAIAHDGSGGVWVGGFTTAAFPGNVLTGGSDALLVRLDAAGNISFVKQFASGAGQNSRIDALAVTPAGSVFAVGATSGAFPGQTTLGGTDVFAGLFQADGTQSWIRQFGASTQDRGAGARVLANGNFLALGTLDSTAVVREFSPAGTALSGATLNTTQNDSVFAAAATADGVVFTAGMTLSPYSGQVQSGQVDAAVMRFNPNRAPLVTATLPVVAANEGTIAANTGTWSDPDNNSVSLLASSGAIVKNANGTWSWTGPAADGPASYLVTITAFDSTTTTTATFTVNVANLPPVLGAATGPASAVPMGTAVTIAAPVSDPAGTNDTVLCRFTWDDGTPDTVVNPAAGACTAPHTYAAPGVYSVLITATDEDGGAATTRFDFVIVFDPSAGFVTGGGWINSPAGAYLAQPTLTGRANFGFVSRYQKGANVPTGQTEFHFQAGSFRFDSEAYQWLVVAGARAQFKGEGKVNGESGFGFMITAVDGQINGGGGADKFRIKVWRKSTATTPEALVYDNGLGASDDINSGGPQALGGGSIHIQNR